MRHEVDVHSFVYPDDRRRSVTDGFGRAFKRLQTTVDDVVPCRLSSYPPRIGDTVHLVTIRHDGFPQDGWHERLVAHSGIEPVKDIDGRAASGTRTYLPSSGGTSGGAPVRSEGDASDRR